MTPGSVRSVLSTRRDVICRAHAGFTLVELVVTIILISILAAVAAPRIFGRSAFDSRAFFDRSQSIVRFAQKIAIAQRRTVTVCVSASITASLASDCAVPLTDNSGNALQVPAPSGVTVTSSAPSITFNGLGQPSSALTIALNSTIPGDPARQITVAAETGYVSATP